MAPEWVSLRLGSVCTKIGSGATPRGGKETYLESGEFTLIRSQNVYNDRFSHNGLAFLSKAQADQLSNVEVQIGDVLVNITGDSVARVCQVDPTVLPARVNQHVAIVRPDPQILDPEFLRYYLIQNTSQNHLLSLAGGGATRNALTKAMLESLEIRAPKDVALQRRIARTLGTLDDKIELNRRMAATLEEMARALFKSWFVDFDPVRAKAEGRPTGLPPDIDALFPDELAESEVGLIPKGWKPGSIKDLCEMLVNGSTPSRGRAEFWTDGTIPWFRTGELSDSFLLDAGEKITPVGYAGSSTKLLPRHSVVMAIYAAPTVGRLGITTMDATFNQAMTGMVAKTEIGPWFLFESLYWLRQWFNDRANGAAQQNISKAIVEEAPVVRPTRALLSVFNMMAEPLFMRREKIEMECKVLSEVRDTLLPKLISGEIEVAGGSA